MNSYIYEFKDLPSTDTPYSAETFTAMQNKLLDSIYPIGSVIIKDDDIDYSNYLGFTWEKSFIGKFLVGVDENDNDEVNLSFKYVGRTGGSKYTEKHSHGQYIDNLGTKTPYALADGGGQSVSGRYLGGSYSSYSGPQVLTTEFGTGNAGNLPPYQVVAYWKRVA